MINTIKYFRDKEWSMGNGQCPECYGNEPGKWYPHSCVETSEEEGHQPDCILAKSLEELGEKTIYATLTKKMKEEKAKQQWFDFYLMTFLGIKAPEGSIGRDIQESYWKDHPPKTYDHSPQES